MMYETSEIKAVCADCLDCLRPCLCEPLYQVSVALSAFLVEARIRGQRGLREYLAP